MNYVKDFCNVENDRVRIKSFLHQIIRLPMKDLYPLLIINRHMRINNVKLSLYTHIGLHTFYEFYVEWRHENK